MGRLDPGAPRYLGNRIALLFRRSGEVFPFRLFRRRHNRRDGYVCAAIAFGRERHFALTEREERVVAAKADIAARMEFGAALAHEDLAAIDGFAAKTLYAETTTRCNHSVGPTSSSPTARFAVVARSANQRTSGTRYRPVGSRKKSADSVNAESNPAWLRITPSGAALMRHWPATSANEYVMVRDVDAVSRENKPH